MDEIEKDIDRLYGLPPGEFTAARNEAARELRRAGRRDEADRVKALRRPTAAAGAVNRLVREHRAGVEEFLRAAAALRDAQFSGAGDLEAATRRERDALAPLLAAGGEQVRQSLLAAAVDDDAARQLLEARLDRELEPRGFGTLLAHAPAEGRRLGRASRPARSAPGPAHRRQTTSARTKPEKAEPPEKRPKPAAEKKPGAGERPDADPGAAGARLQDAKDELRAAEAQERQARRHWEQTRAELETARAAVEQAQRALDRARGDR